MTDTNMIIIYQNAFKEFDNYIKRINAENTLKNHSGYIIDLNKYYDFRNTSIFLNDPQLLIPENPDSNNINNKLYKGSKFIIINQKLHDLICLSNSHNMKYQINSGKTILYTPDKKVIKFLNNNNILGCDSLLEIKDNYIINTNYNNNNLDKIYKDIINYFNNGKEINKIINNNKNIKKSYQGILANKIWVDKWKTYSYYNLIKQKFLIGNMKYKKNDIISIIKQQTEKYYLNYEELNDIQDYILDDIKNLNSNENSIQSFVILSKNFIDSFPYKTINLINFNLSFQNIEIIGNPSISFQTIANIISIKNKKENINIKGNKYIEENNNIEKDNNMDKLDYLKHLLRNYYLYTDVFSDEKKKFGKFGRVGDPLDIIKVYIVNKLLIINLYEKFHLNDIIHIIKGNPQFNNITYNNFDENYSMINKFLENNNSEYIFGLQNSGVLNLSQDESVLNIKYPKHHENLKYIDDFCIIDEKFVVFLYKLYNKKIKYVQAHFIFKNNLIFVIINSGMNIYEFASFNSNYNFKAEYLLEFINFNKNNDIKTINQILFNFINSNDLNPLINLGNPLKIHQQNISFNIYPIDNIFDANIIEKYKKNQINNNEKYKKYNSNNDNKKLKLNQTYNQNYQNFLDDDKNENIYITENINKSINPGMYYKKPISNINNNYGSKIRESFQQNNYFLIDKELFQSIKNIKINSKNNIKNIDNNVYDHDFTKMLQKNFNNFGLFQKIKFENILKNNKQRELKYPIDFYIINQKEFNKIQYYLKENINILTEEIILSIIDEDYIFVFKNKNDKLIYIYSENEKLEKKLYKPKCIIECNSQIKSARNYIFNYITNPKYFKKLLEAPKTFEEKHKIKLYSIPTKNESNNDIINNSIKINEIINDNLINSKIGKIFQSTEKNLEKYLKFSIDLIKERNAFLEKLKMPYININNSENYYLIYKDYVLELNKIFYFDKIKLIMFDNEEKNGDELLNVIKTELSKDIQNNINNLNEEIIQSKLESKTIINIDINYYDNIESERLFFYKDYYIVSKEIVNKFKLIDINISQKCIKMNCVLDENKIIMCIKDNIINIANNKNGFILVKYIIKSDNAKLLFNEFIKKGYKFIEKYLSSFIIDIPIKHNNESYKIKTKIYKLTSEGIIDYMISDKLKVLILLAISQNNYINNQRYDIYLINPKWLERYNY